MSYRYSIFETRRGYFGLISTEKGVLRTSLPQKSISIAKDKLLNDLSKANISQGSFPLVEKLVTDYYNGINTNFSRMTVIFEGISEFAKDILTACQKVTYGQTMSYGQLANLSGHTSAGRAVGNAMAKNQTPLIIPCHRIIKANGQIGGFSALGGTNTKQKMLDLEAKTH
jgi:methylated-DNA-[protein]-cysteine S-methyltransferase